MCKTHDKTISESRRALAVNFRIFEILKNELGPLGWNGDHRGIFTSVPKIYLL